jgi:hypothetical protein
MNDDQRKVRVIYYTPEGTQVQMTVTMIDQSQLEELLAQRQRFMQLNDEYNEQMVEDTGYADALQVLDRIRAMR